MAVPFASPSCELLQGWGPGSRCLAPLGASVQGVLSNAFKLMGRGVKEIWFCLGNTGEVSLSLCCLFPHEGNEIIFDILRM